MYHHRLHTCETIVVQYISTLDGYGTIFIKSGTASEVIFLRTSTLTNQVFKRLPNVKHAYFKLRQQAS
jgi:hypothetical protein